MTTIIEMGAFISLVILAGVALFWNKKFNEEDPKPVRKEYGI